MKAFLARIASLAGICVCTALFTTAASAGPEDDTLRALVTRETDYMDPIHASSTESHLLGRIIYDTLIYFDARTREMKPSLAESWTWIDDTTIEFKLRNGVVFHNGEPFDAADVVFTFGELMNMENKFRQQRADFGNIAGAEPIDSNTVRVTLKNPDPTFENMLSSRIVIWPDEYSKSSGIGIHATKPVGTGPYRLDSFRAGSEYTLKANPDYFAGARPVASIGTIQVRVIPEVQTQIAELMAGSADMATSLSPTDVAALDGFPGISVKIGPATRIHFLSMNAAGGAENNPLRKVEVRRAISHAINRPELVASLMSPEAPVLHAHCSPAQAYCMSDGLPAYDFNPAKARELLAAAGYADGIQLNLMAETSLRPVAEAIQGYLSNVGINVALDTFPLPAWRDKFIAGESQMSVLGWGTGITAADISYTLGVFFDQSGTDYAKDAEITAWNQEAGHSLDAAKREELYRKSLTRISEQAYTLPLYGSVVTYVAADTVNFDVPVIDFLDLSVTRWAN